MKRFSNVVLLVGVLLVIAVALLYAWAYYGGRGSETVFSPDTLEYKSRSELRDPLFGQIIYRSSYSPPSRYGLVEYLVAQGYWTPIATEEPRWIWFYGWNDQWSLGYGSLARQLSKSRDFWKQWTEENGAFAQVLWPRVLEQLRDPSRPWHDDLVGDILRRAQDSRSYEEFQWWLEELLKQEYEFHPLSEETRRRWKLPELKK